VLQVAAHCASMTQATPAPILQTPLVQALPPQSAEVLQTVHAPALQEPLRHCSFTLHGAVFALTHIPDVHWAPVPVHWVLALLHAVHLLGVPEQRFVAHRCGEPDVQVWPVAARQAPAVQVWLALHVVGVVLHVPAPLQALLDAVLPEQDEAHRLGAVVSGPAAVAAQLPSEPLTLHAVQAGHDPELQQTPSTQFPLAHCAAPVHVCPLPSLQPPEPSHALVPVQVPTGSLSTCPGAMSLQVPGVVPLQVWQVPQLAELQQTPSTQFPLAQSPPAVQLCPSGCTQTEVAALHTPLWQSPPLWTRAGSHGAPSAPFSAQAPPEEQYELDTQFPSTVQLALQVAVPKPHPRLLLHAVVQQIFV